MRNAAKRLSRIVDDRPLMLGPFTLEQPVARGGMAEVWRARHVEDDVPVAIKVLLEHRVERSHHRTQFEQEAVALAVMHHPNVVQVFDRGTVDAATARASDGRLPDGAPYVVLEWLPHGSLWRYRSRLGWVELAPVLRALLLALGHVHARGWVHRDLKPSNVLVSRDRRPVLGDFGLAHRRGQPVLLRAGTPSYMAPEQFRDQWRDLGPWTDLYGFGCLAWTLWAGRAPYARSGWNEVREAHLHAPLPRLPRRDGPAEFEGWLRELLAKDPARRLPTAADALAALEQLAENEHEDTTMPSLDFVEEPVDPTQSEQRAVEFDPDPEPWPEGSVGRYERPPVVVEEATLRHEERPDEGPWLRAVGRGVLEYRQAPMVGRARERRILWDALVAVHKVPLARAVVVGGARGVGRTRLVADLVHRAHELGMAWTLGANGNRIHDGSLAERLRAHFGLDASDEVDEIRLAEVARRYGTTDPRDQAHLAALVRQDPEPEAIGALGRHLAALGARRPVLFVIDDDGATPDRDALAGLVDWALSERHTSPTPVLFVWVTSPSEQADPSRRWVGRPGVDRITVGPLPHRALRSVVRGWMGLDETHVVRVARPSAGHAAVARRLVQDFVATGEHRPLPTDPQVVAQLADALPDDADWHALELAATMGMVVPVAEWQPLLASINAVRDAEWVRTLSTHGVIERLGRATENGLPEQFRFASPQFRQALLDRARDHGRLTALYERTVKARQSEPPVGRWTWGDQLAAAGLEEAAARAWLAAARTYLDRGDPAGAAVIVQAASTAATTLDLDDRDLNRAIAWTRQRCAVERGAFDELDTRGADPPWEHIARFLRGESTVRPDPASPAGRYWLGRAQLRAGALDGAIGTWTGRTDAVDAFTGMGLAWAATAAGWKGDGVAAHGFIDAIGSRDRFGPVRWARAAVRAERARAEGRRAEAIERLTEVVAALASSGGLDPVRPQLQLAVLLCTAGRYGEAERWVKRATIEAQRRQDPAHRRFVDIVGMLVAIGLDDEPRWRALLTEPAEAAADPEVFATLALVGEALAERGQGTDAQTVADQVAAWQKGAGRRVEALRWWQVNPT